MRLCHIKWKIKQLPNVIVRLCTFDHFYVCEECKHIHKRDGKEIRLDVDETGLELMFHPIWYGSVHRECFDKQQARVMQLIRDAIFGNRNTI